MKIVIKKDENILRAPSGFVVIPVNGVGVMGKGLALQFKQKFPIGYNYYRDVCNSGEFDGKYIDGWEEFIFFKTKEHWRDPSIMEDIIKGLYELKEVLIEDFLMDDINIPKIGCGLGGLDWVLVKNAIIQILGTVENEKTLYIYE